MSCYAEAPARRNLELFADFSGEGGADLRVFPPDEGDVAVALSGIRVAGDRGCGEAHAQRKVGAHRHEVIRRARPKRGSLKHHTRRVEHLTVDRKVGIEDIEPAEIRM